jgi:hypothetical protein
VQVDCPLAISDRAKEAPALSNRLKLPPSGLEGKIRLQEAILVGNYQHQVKFSELTLDMFRVMQVLERERVGSAFPRPSPLDHSPDVRSPPHPTHRMCVVCVCVCACVSCVGPKNVCVRHE